MPPRVDVIIPTFNSAASICEAVDSALAQTFQAIAVLVVDDGSTDDTRELVASRFGRQSNVSLLHQANAGPAAARNLGIRQSRSDLVAFLDSDDLWAPDKLEKQVGQLDGHPEAGLSFCDVTIEGDGDPRVTRFMRKRYRGDTSVRGIIEADFPGCTPSVVVRRTVLDELGGFDESFPNNEDWDLWIRIVTRYPVFFIEEPLAVVRARKESISRSRVLENRLSELRLWTKHAETLQQAGCPRSVVRHKLARTHRRIAQTLRRQGRGAEAGSHYLAWWRMHPWEIQGLLWWLTVLVTGKPKRVSS